jgi:lipopolysaccharide transport system permease protein
MMNQVVSPTANARALQSLGRSISQYRELLWEMTRRDITERQAGLAFPAFWVVGQPILMMLVYVFVFSFIFKVRMGVDDGRLKYTAFLLAGLVPWLAFQEAIGRASTCITENKSLIKQIAFPIEILPLKIPLSTLLVVGIGSLFPLALTVLAGTAKVLWWLLLPVPIFSYLLLTVGLVYIIASAGVFVRDIRNVVQLGLMIGLFVHPILYVPGMLPHWVNVAFEFSPLTHIIWTYRDAVFGTFTHPVSWALAPLYSACFLVLGFRMFKALSHMFGDAL